MLKSSVRKYQQFYAEKDIHIIQWYNAYFLILLYFPFLRIWLTVHLESSHGRSKFSITLYFSYMVISQIDQLTKPFFWLSWNHFQASR